MVWKSNLLIDGEMFTYDRFLLDEQYFGSFDAFHSRAFFKDKKDAFRLGLYLDSKHFPKHLFFANFQCLRCGLCCKNSNTFQISDRIILKWKSQRREDILEYVDEELKEIYAYPIWAGCHFCRKFRNKHYYGCKVHRDKEHILDCKVYLCSKSLPIANINYKDIDELIELIGVSGYYALIERKWNEIFDYSTSEYKTHRQLSKK